MALSEQEFTSLQGDPELGRSLDSASRREPNVAAEALKTPFSDDYYQQNKSAIQNQAKLTAIDTADISNKSPKTANYLKDKNNAAVSSDDLHVLRGMEAVIDEHDKGFWGRRGDDARRGFAMLRRSGEVLGVQEDTSMAEHVSLIDETGATNFEDYTQARISKGLKVGALPTTVLDYLRADKDKKQSIKQRISRNLIGGVIDIAERSKEIEAIPRSRAAQKFAMAKSFNEAIGAVAENPLEIISGITTESFVQFAPAIPLAMAGGPVAIAGVGATSFFGEYTNDMVGSMQEAGIDVQNPDELEAAFSDPERMAAWKDHAIKKGIPIALFDALSMGIAGKFVARVTSRPGKAAAGAGEALALQPALGAAGEAAGQLAAGDELSGKDILAEALGEILPGTVETAAGSYTHYRDSVKEAKVRKIDKTVNSLVEQSTLDKIISYAQGSETNKRAQGNFESFINTLGEDKTVLIPADIAAELEDAPIYLKANEGGPDISVPLSTFATEIATNESWMAVLRPHIKLSEGGMSQNEMQTDDNSDLKSLLDKAQEAQETLTEAEQVFATVKDQLVATGMQSEETARFSAQLYPAAATVFAEKARKMGHDVSVAEVFDMMGFSVEAGKPAVAEPEAPKGTIIDQIFEQDLIPADLEISMESQVIETGETVTETFNAKELNQAVDSKVESYNAFKDCLG